ncbi:tetratricopeptide repeat protein [bacterium]|nr:MAG: tetratricopeptide repeat protein [bacterium]
MDPITDEEDVKYYLGRLYFQEQDYRKAIETYKEGLIINPQSGIILYEIGLAYIKLKKYKKALDYWERLSKIVSPHSFLGIKVKQKLDRKNSPFI